MKKNNEELKNQIADEILNYDARYTAPNFDLVNKDVLDTITGFNIKAKNIIDENPHYDLDEKKETELYKELTSIWRESKEYVDKMPITIKMMGSQAKEFVRVINNAEYSSETLFWGIRIKKHILDNIDKTKYSNDDIQEFDVDLMTIIMAHTILTSSPFKGVTFEGYLMAKLLTDLTEYVKVYNALSNQAQVLSKMIDDWEKQEKPLATLITERGGKSLEKPKSKKKESVNN